MAQIDINNFNQKEKERYSLQKKIDSSYFVFTINGEKYFQIDSYGSSDRKTPGKTSQTIQFDMNVAKKLVEILNREFNLSKK